LPLARWAKNLLRYCKDCNMNLTKKWV
jgi:hypothetical protein